MVDLLIRSKGLGLWGMALLLVLCLVGCEPAENPVAEQPVNESRETPADNAVPPPEVVPEPAKNRKDIRSLAAIQKSGYMRFLVPRADGVSGLTSDGLVFEEYRRLAERFAHSQGVKVKWIYVDYFGQLISHLEEGLGDVIATNLTVTDSRSEKVNFSIPLTAVSEMLILPGKFSDTPLKDLPAMTVTVPKGTSYQESMEEIAAQYPQLAVLPIATHKGDFELIEAVANGEFQATVVDSNNADDYFRLLDDPQNFAAAVGPAVKTKRQIAWAVRKNDPVLLTALNHFFISERIEASAYQQEKRDWPQITAHKTLRLITSNNPASYFIWRGELMGFDYDLVREFADQHKLRLQVIVRDGIDAMWQALQSGEGDLIAASVTITEPRQAMGMVFSRPYLRVTEQLISHIDEPEVKDLAKITSRNIAVNPDKSYYQTLQTLQETLKSPGHTPLKQPHLRSSRLPFNIVEVANATTEELIQAVAAGDYDFTVADSHLAAIETTYRNDIKIQQDLNQQSDIGFALRADQPELKSQLNQFIKQEYRGLFYNVTFNKYFKNKKNIIKNRKHRVEPHKPISPFDEVVKRAAESHGYDWRLITSQMYQESRFNPKAKSYAGAQGLMQVLPRTAKQFGYENLFDPNVGIEAGVVYFAWLKDRFPQDLPLEEQIYFMLAAYNAGHGHVRDARRLAAQLGKDPDKWFGNVEEAMLLLSKPKFHKKARFGYVRGREPVNYVKSIRQRYLSYLVTHGALVEEAAPVKGSVLAKPISGSAKPASPSL